MKSFCLIASVAFVTLVVVNLARADEFQLTYTFGGTNNAGGAGDTLTGTFDGTLSGNLISGITDASFSFEGPSTVVNQIQGFDVDYWGAQQFAVVSLNGLQNNFRFLGDNGQLDSVTGTVSSTYYNVAEIFAWNYSTSITAEDVSGNPYEPLNSSWKVTDLSAAVSSVPDQSISASLLGLVLVGLVAGRRKLITS